MMRALRPARLCTIACVLLVTLNATVGTAEEEPAASAEGPSAHNSRWIPGLSGFGAGLLQERRATTDSLEFGRDDGESGAVIGVVGLSAELSTPVLVNSFGRPRAFMHGDVSLALDTNEGIANDGDPGQPVVPPAVNFPVLGVPNQGTGVRGATEPLVLSAGAGVAFSFEAWERQVRIKPSIEWLWQEDKIRTLLSSVASDGAQVDFCTPCRTVFIDGTSKQDFHSLGPGLELEVDAARAGSFGLITLYASTQAYRLLSDRKVKESLSGVWMTNGVPSGVPDARVDSVYERERWHYRFVVGVRFLWLPDW